MQDFWEIIKKSSQSGSIIVINPSSSDTYTDAGRASPVERAVSPPDEQASDSAPAKDIPAPSAAGIKPPQSRGAEPLRIIGETLAMQELRRNIERLADLDCPVIIRGETGTGKALTARMIHNLSPRRQNRFTAVNCGCFSNDLLVEELFRPGTGIFSGPVEQGDR